MPMNREIWRQFKSLSWKDGEKLIRSIYDPEIESARIYAYKDGFADMFMALHKRFPEWDGQMLHSIAVDAVGYQRGLETPEELIEQIYAETGFDIRSSVEDQPFEYIPIREEPKRKRPSRALMPCKCGCKRREHLYKPGADDPEGLMCMVCGLTVWGHSQMDVIRRWNEEVKQGV